MQRTNRIYEAPSRLSRGLVVGLSIAVIMMAGWLAVTVTLSESVTTSAEGATDATASPPGDEMAASAAPDTPRPAARSVHFDWPEQFASATARPSAPPPAQTALPLAPTELPVARDPGRSPWPAVPGARDRSLPARRPAGGAAQATDVVADPATPASSRTAAARETAAPTPRQGQRRQKPRVENEAAQ